MIRVSSVVIFLVALKMVSCNAQEGIDTISLRNSDKYIVNSIDRQIESFSIKNTSKNCVWIWFEDGKSLDNSMKGKIEDYFFSTNNQSENSLFQIAMDRNIEEFIPSIYQTFVAKIPSDHLFTIEIILEGELINNEIESLTKLLNDRLIIMDENYIIKTFPRLNHLNEIIFYKSDRIIMEYQDIVN